MDPWDPFSFSGMGSAGDPFNYYADPGYSTQFSPSGYTPTGSAMVGPGYDRYSRYNDPGREAYAPPTSPSQVPGTSGSPAYTPSATPGGVSQSDGTGTPSQEPNAPYNGPAIANSPYGILAGLGGRVNSLLPSWLGGPTTGTNIKDALQVMQAGQNIAKPPPSPFAPGGGPAQPQQQQNPQAQQVMRLYGVDYQTALQLINMMQPSRGTTQQQQPSYPQMAMGGRPIGPTIVGERGPELFVPDMPGSIVPMQRPPVAGPQLQMARRNAAIHAAMMANRRFG